MPIVVARFLVANALLRPQLVNMNGINRHPPSKEEMDAVFALCRNNHWSSCLQCLKTNPMIGTTTMVMVSYYVWWLCVCVCRVSNRNSGTRSTFSLLLPLELQDNHIATTVMHQAITSKGNVQARAEVSSTSLAFCVDFLFHKYPFLAHVVVPLSLPA